MEVGYRLPLYADSHRNDVVGYGKLASFEGGSEFAQPELERESPFAMVNEYRQWLTVQTVIVPMNLSRNCVNCPPRHLSPRREMPTDRREP